VFNVKNSFQFGSWLVDPSTNSIEKADDKRQMEPRTMDVLLALCQARGEVVSAEQLLEQCWGHTFHGDSPVHKNIAQLRRLLGDDARAPIYIETIRMRGYRTVAALDFNARDATRLTGWDAGSPFRGLLAFDEAHADVFFGRTEVIRNLVETVTDQVRSGFALTMVLGPSGIGKTSLIQAGLLPALTRIQNPGQVGVLASTTFALRDQGEQTLFTALAGALLDLQWQEHSAFPGENAISLGVRLEQDCGAVIAELSAALATHAPALPGCRFAIFIDGFEALFNVNRLVESERRAFLNALEQLARSRAVLLLIACRNDFYPSIAKYPVLTEGKRHGGHFDLSAPSFSDIAHIIRRPAAAAKLTFGIDPVTQAQLDDILCASAAESPDALPLLQYCLQELYRLRTPQGELSFEAFHQLGDLEGAIGQRAEQVVLGMAEAQRATLAHIMSLLIVLSPDGDSVTSQRTPWSALRGEEAHQAVAALVEARLFVTDLAGATPVFGVAHDAILRRWPRMTDWIEVHRNALRTRGRLAQQAGRWRDEGQPNDLLLPSGKLLAEARELQLAGVLTLTDIEHELIHVSHRRVRYRERLRWMVLTLIVALAVLASALGLSAMAAKRSAELRRNEAESLMDFMLGDFADKLRPLGRLDFLESVSGKALQYLRGSQDYDRSPTALTLRAKGLQVIGEVGRSHGDSRLAIDALTQANAILIRQHAQAPQDIEVLKSLGANAYWVGQMHKDQNNWEAADKAWREYQQFADLLHQREPDNSEWWVEQSYAHNNLGNLAYTRGQPALAVPEFMQSIALKRRALDKAPASRSLAAELADSYSWLASAKEALGELHAAQQLYAQELQLVLHLHEQFPGESLWVHRHVIALQHRAWISVAVGLDEHALADYDEAKRLFTQIMRLDPNNRAWQFELANLEQDRLSVLAHTLPAAKMLPKLTEVHGTLQTMLARDPKNAAWARREAVGRTRVAAALLDSGQHDKAQQEGTAALNDLTRLYAANRSNLSTRLALVESLLLTAAIQQQQKQDAKIIMMTCRQAHGIIGNDNTSTMNHQLLAPWVRISTCLQDKEAAHRAATRLAQIGYQDHAYLQFISTH
jgi:DNA-binding winged helix-turn-helix (wHTH) protein/tetratricopeptide (TPR) repeat protein